MSTLGIIAIVCGGAFAIYLLCAISYSIGLHNGIEYMKTLLHRESEDTE